jgi:hypothetical protein
MDEYYIWNKAQKLFELITNSSQTKKDPDQKNKISNFQFSRLTKVPSFSKLGSYFKADLEMVFKSLQKKYEVQFLDIYGFFDAIEILSAKIYKDQEEMSYLDKVSAFIGETTEFFEELIEQQNEEAQEQATQGLNTSAKTKRKL